MKLYNTLTRKKEEFVPLDGKTVHIYSCGPTVYNTASIGNLRAYIFTDILKKTLNLYGYKVFDVMNLTDVGHLVSDADEGEDKIEKSARAQKTTPQEIAKKYTDLFFNDCDKLNIRRPQIIAPATQYVNEMIEFIKGLEVKGYTYITSDGVYFDSSKCANYNKLSRQPIENNVAGARIDMGEKKNLNDFALWKFVPKNSLQKWDSPWNPPSGRSAGAPGWHIECSTISLHHLGNTFDIHTGGIDHIPTHHTNEIAQTESLTGEPMANFWLHNEFVTIDGGKMSKSLGNVYTIDDLQKRGHDPLAFRYFCLLATYRTLLNFTWEGLESAGKAYENLVKQLTKHYLSDVPSSQKTLKDVKDAINSALFDDLNTPQALAQVWELLKKEPSHDIYDAVIEYDKVFSLDLTKRVKESLIKENIPQNIVAIANTRQAAKSKRDFKTADELRTQISNLGYEITDTKDGYNIKKT